MERGRRWERRGALTLKAGNQLRRINRFQAVKLEVVSWRANSFSSTVAPLPMLLAGRPWILFVIYGLVTSLEAALHDRRPSLTRGPLQLSEKRLTLCGPGAARRASPLSQIPDFLLCFLDDQKSNCKSSANSVTSCF